MDIYGKVYIRVIRAQVILSLVFVFVICLVNYLIILYIERNERKEPDQVQDFWFHGVGSRFYRMDSLL